MDIAGWITEWATSLYVVTLLVVIGCLYRGQRQGEVNLWDMVRTSKDGKVFTDRRKFFETGAFVVSTVAFSYLVVVDKMTEFYAGIYVATWVTSAALRDRAQLKDKALGATTEGAKP